MTSCSDDDSTPTSNPDETTVLLKKMIWTEDGESVTSDLTYNGTKLISIINEYESDIYTYDGDKIVERKIYEGSEFTQHDFFEYNENGQLATYIRHSPDVGWGNKIIFTYNNDGTLSTEEYIGDMESQTQLNDTGIVTMENGNIVSYVTENYTYTYSFDTKNSPYSNITGMAALYLAFQEGGINNVISENYASASGANEFNYTTTYEYNSLDFPTNQTVTGGITYEVQYFYE